MHIEDDERLDLIQEAATCRDRDIDGDDPREFAAFMEALSRHRALAASGVSLPYSRRSRRHGE